MLKKLLMAAILGFAIMFAGLQNQAEAYDLYVGNSPATGWDCYLMTETIVRGNRDYSATLKMVTNSGRIKYLDYTFYLEYNSTRVFFRNSQGYSGYIDRYDTPIEWNMYHKIINTR